MIFKKETALFLKEPLSLCYVLLHVSKIYEKEKTSTFIFNSKAPFPLPHENCRLSEMTLSYLVAFCLFVFPFYGKIMTLTVHEEYPGAR